MTTTSAYTAVIRQDGPWWIGWVEEVPGVNAQEQSREALLESLREVLREALEFNRQDALEAAGPGGNHSWWWNPSRNLRSSIPRHTEIKELLVRKICKDLGLPPP